MKSDVSDILAIAGGYRRGHDRLEQLRFKEIREAKVVVSLPLFTTAFRMAIANQNSDRNRPAPLSKTLRRYLGVDL